MKRTLLLTLLSAVGMTVAAQTINVHTGRITVAVPAEQAGDMTYTDGTSLTIMGHTYNLADIDSITVNSTPVEATTVSVTYAADGAKVRVAGDVAPYLTITAAGADVSVVAAPDYLQEVTYVLTGTSADGSFTMDGEFKSTLELRDLTLTNLRGPAINIENGKRIDVIVPTGTTTTLADAVGGTHKACFFVNGHPEFSGGGRLVLTGNSRHAFASDEYTYLKADFGTMEVKGAVSDGLHVEQYFRMAGGTVTVSGAKGDGIDVSITKDATDEMNGEVHIEGGTITLDVAADDVKGIKCDNAMTISGGTVNCTVSGLGTKGLSVGTDLLINQASGNATAIKMAVTGTTYMPGDATLESKCRGIKVKGDFTFDGGNIDISATGAKSKAISVDGYYYYKSGSLNCAVDASNI